ncbi:hypothetical protein L1049_000187 [Liquidambar formosana]|uniref:Ion transport domain-containing protein n=1 Tax=Liquidambar formosana TaxID=63359 RepID=A0AAP0R2G4_LIQFO
MAVCGRRVFRVSMSGEEVEHFSRETNHYSLPTTWTLPSLAGRSNPKVKLRSFVLIPNARAYRVWETCLVLLVVYTAWESPFIFGFLKKPEGPLSIVDDVVNGFFAIDIVLTFFVPYLDKATNLPIDDPKRIAWKYITSWFAFDVISTIPSAIPLNIFPKNFCSYGLFNLLRLLRLRRLSALFARLEKARISNYLWVRFVKLLGVTLFVVHCAGCSYYLLAANHHDPKRTWIGASMENFLEQSLWIRYVTSIYWSITIVATGGPGDFHAQNAGERLFEIFFMLVIFGLSPFLSGRMTNLLVRGNYHLKELKDPILQNVLVETVPPSLCFATQRGDDSLLQQLLEHRLDPNDSDINGRTALHIAASEGRVESASLLLRYGADPNSRDLAGNVPLWLALLRDHQSVIELLLHNSAKIYYGDVGQFAYTAAKLHDLNLLKKIFQYGGDVTCPTRNGTTALHVAVCEHNSEMVKFLLDQGAEIKQEDMNGSTPRNLADLQGHEDTKIPLQSKKGTKTRSVSTIPEEHHGNRFPGRFKGEPSSLPLPHEGLFPDAEGSCSQSHPRRREEFGIMPTAHTSEEDLFLSHSDSMC